MTDLPKCVCRCGVTDASPVMCKRFGKFSFVGVLYISGIWPLSYSYTSHCLYSTISFRLVWLDLYIYVLKQSVILFILCTFAV